MKFTEEQLAEATRKAHEYKLERFKAMTPAQQGEWLHRWLLEPDPNNRMVQIMNQRIKMNPIPNEDKKRAKGK
jgi:hypothetical protein